MFRFSASLILVFVIFFSEKAKSGPKDLEKDLQSEELARSELIEAEKSERKAIEEKICGRIDIIKTLKDLAHLCPALALQKRGKRLGKGTHGTVYEAMTTKGLHAYKVFHLLCSRDRSCARWCDHYWYAVECFVSELCVMIKMQDKPNIMSATACIFPDGSEAPGVFMPLMEGDLASLLRLYPKGLPAALIDHYLLQITAGLVHLHSRGIVHCDLKPQNILVKRLSIKIGDFGSANSCEDDEICTLWYRAPELILKGTYSSSIDIFSLGCIFFQCLTGKVLFPSDSEIVQLFSIFRLSGTINDDHWPEGKLRPHYQENFPRWRDRREEFLTAKLGKDSKYIPLIASMLSLNPSLRMTAQEIFHTLHPRERVPFVLPQSARGLEVVDVPDDGDCGFHAVSEGLGTWQISRERLIQRLKSLKLREVIETDSPEGEVIAAAIQNILPEDFDPGVADINIWTIGFDLWIEKLAGGLWLSHADLAAMAFLFDFTLVIHTFGFNLQTINPGQDQIVHIAHVSTSQGGPFNHYIALLDPALAIAPPAPPIPPPTPPAIHPKPLVLPPLPLMVIALTLGSLSTNYCGVRGLLRILKER